MFAVFDRFRFHSYFLLVWIDPNTNTLNGNFITLGFPFLLINDRNVDKF